MMNKKKRAKQSQRSIYIRTLAGFMIFYLLAMITMTAVMQRSVRASNVSKLLQAVQEVKASAYENDDNYWFNHNGRKWVKTMDDVLYDNQLTMRLLRFPAKFFICDSQYNILTQSGTMLTAYYPEGSGRTTMSVREDGLSDADLLEIYQLTEVERQEKLSARHDPQETFMRQDHVLQALGHWEGHHLVASELYVIEETWQMTESKDGKSISGELVERKDRPIAHYILGERHPEDEIMNCHLEVESYWPVGAFSSVYNSRIQQAYHDSEQLFEQAVNRFKSEGENGQIASAGWGEGFWAYDIYALKYCDAEVEGQPIGYIIATARTYPIWQTMRMLWPVYLAGLIVAVFLAGLMAWQLNKLQRRQQQLEDSRQALMVAVAHELKNPLSVIKNYSEGLLEDIAQEKRDEYLRVIIDETEQLDQMVVELLSLTRLTTAGETLRKEAVDLNTLVQKLGDRYQHALQERQLHLAIDIAPQTLILADERLLEQAVANLLSNAINYSPAGGEITITADADQLTVANQGPQIADDQWPHLFEPFYKAEDDRSRTGQGTGLGLAIVQAIAQLHDMTADGQNRDDGVAFTLHFNKAATLHGSSIDA